MILVFSITFVIGLVGGTIISLQYSQSFYVCLDFPEFSAIEWPAVQPENYEGSKGRRFYLAVSFIPLYLLGLLTCGIGLLFVIPYANTASANFYLELMSYRTGIISKHAFGGVIVLRGISYDFRSRNPSCHLQRVQICRGFSNSFDGG